MKTDDGENGTLKDVIETGANEVYVVEFEKYGEVLIPAIHECILDVDVENMQMEVHLLRGSYDEFPHINFISGNGDERT